MRNKTLTILICANILLLCIAVWRSDALPPQTEITHDLMREPIQVKLEEGTFTVTKNDIDYTIQPLYNYDLVGLVVSKHNADTWWDYIHRETNDHINITDLCVIWGNNIRSGSYLDMTFSSGQFTCYPSTSSAEAYAKYDPTALSNNHLLTDNSDLAKRMRSVRIGDQIHLRGKLAIYSHNQGFAYKRGTSTTRTDTGNGACETIFVDDFQIIKGNSKTWRGFMWLFSLSLIAFIIYWFARPVRFDDT
jgi:hypothetical protein